jgi:hypothetical protein
LTTESVEGIASAVGRMPGGQHVGVRPDEEDGGAEPRPDLEQEHGSDREQAAHERRQERPKKDAGAERRDERANLPARESLPLADHDDREKEAWSDEVREAIEERGRPQEGLVPQETEALREP